MSSANASASADVLACATGGVVLSVAWAVFATTRGLPVTVEMGLSVAHVADLSESRVADRLRGIMRRDAMTVEKQKMRAKVWLVAAIRIARGGMIGAIDAPQNIDRRLGSVLSSTTVFYNSYQ